MHDQTYSVELTAQEAMRIRLALTFGDPKVAGRPDPVLESAKAKLKSVEAASDAQAGRDVRA